MKKLAYALLLLPAMSMSQAWAEDRPVQVEEKTVLNYSTGGYATVEIQKPVAHVFKSLTNVNIWPDINKGVTLRIQPENVKVQQGIKFKETIASPIPGIKNWTNEWHVLEYIPNKKFVIAGWETYAQVPIHSKISYEFAEKSQNTTEFNRTIEVTLDKKFIEGASKQEVEALYRFVGSQWEMAQHLKNYIETH